MVGMAPKNANFNTLKLGGKSLYRASTEIVFQAGHFLRFEMEQEEPHRHDWRVRAVVESEELDENQLVMDFHLLAKRIVHQKSECCGMRKVIWWRLGGDC